MREAESQRGKVGGACREEVGSHFHALCMPLTGEGATAGTSAEGSGVAVSSKKINPLINLQFQTLDDQLGSDSGGRRDAVASSNVSCPEVI